MAKLSPAFVLTIGASMTACTPKQGLPGNPPPIATVTPTGSGATPPPQPDAQPTAQPTAQPSGDRPTSGEANPRTSDGRSIRLAYNDDSCFFYEDFPPLQPGEMRPPGSAPPRKATPCPAVMNDPAFKTCRGGSINFKAEGCECFEPGNPPRVRPNACPSGQP